MIRAVWKPHFLADSNAPHPSQKKMKMKSFIIKLTAISLGIALIGWLVFSLFLPQYYLSVLPFLLLFFYAVTISIQAYQRSLANKDIGKFMRSNMLITFFKLVLFSIVAVIYIALETENAIPFVIYLMLLYLVFTFIEVAESAKIARSKKK